MARKVQPKIRKNDDNPVHSKNPAENSLRDSLMLTECDYGVSVAVETMVEVEVIITSRTGVDVAVAPTPIVGVRVTDPTGITVPVVVGVAVDVSVGTAVAEQSTAARWRSEQFPLLHTFRSNDTLPDCFGPWQSTSC